MLKIWIRKITSIYFFLHMHYVLCKYDKYNKIFSSTLYSTHLQTHLQSAVGFYSISTQYILQFSLSPLGLHSLTMVFVIENIHQRPILEQDETNNILGKLKSATGILFFFITNLDWTHSSYREFGYQFFYCMY